MRVGIYSGTFDPIHEGHVLFAHVAAEQFGIEKVLVIPEIAPRFKEAVSPIEHRLRMAELATVSQEPTQKVVNLPDLPSHTINGVISYIYELFPDDEYFIILGSDVFRNIEEWGDRDDEDGGVAEIADKIGFIVGLSSMAEHDELQAMAERMGLNVKFVEPPLHGVSSRKIRDAIASSSSDIHGLNEEVQRYIQFEGLYGASEN